MAVASSRSMIVVFQSVLWGFCVCASSGVLVLSILLFISFRATADGKWFRLYSIATTVTVIVFGARAGLDGARIAAQLPTPWMGVKERISVYSSLLWVLVLAVVLMRAEKRALKRATTQGLRE